MSEGSLIEEINNEAFELVKLIVEVQKVQPQGKPILKGTLAERDMVDFSDRIDDTGIATVINPSEKPSAISFEEKEKSYGLDQKDFGKYHSFVRKIFGLKQFCGVASEGFISKKAFAWIIDVYIKRKPSNLIVDFLDNELRKSINPYCFYFPVLNLEMEEPFKLGNVEFMYFTRKEMDEQFVRVNEARAKAKIEPVTEEGFKNIFRLNYQGRVLVKVQATAESEKAEEIAKVDAALAVDILKLFWATVLIPEQRLMFDLDYRLGYQLKTLCLSEKLSTKSEYALGVKFNNPYSDLTPAHLAYAMSNGLQEFSDFIALKKDDKFYNLIIQAIEFTANSLSIWDLNKRCISIITTLESLLLKDEERSNSKLVKQRLLKIVAKDTGEANRTEEAFTHVYNVRHAMAHKAERLGVDSKKLTDAQFIMVHLLRVMIHTYYTGKYSDMENFINSIQ